MEEITIHEDVKNITWDYDGEADVLYLSVGDPKPAVGLDIGDGVIVRYDEPTREVVGLTIIGMKERLSKMLNR